MSDFFQNGVITTLHLLNRENEKILENELIEHTKHRPIALVLPALSIEFRGDALSKITKELATLPYIKQIIVTLGRTKKEEFIFAKHFFSSLPQKTVIIWNDGPMMQRLYKSLEVEFCPWERGKGLNTWMAYGYVLASDICHVIASHDCDILSYKKQMLTRLCYPVASIRLNYEFCKGYYSRISSGRLHGRVTRLFVSPLIRALMRTIGKTPFLVYLDSFRYPLAGEFAMTADLAWRNRIPADWGLEIGVLAEIYRTCSLSSVCQVDLTDNYEHKHQELSPNDVSKGLLKMAIDIAQNLFRTLASDGAIFSNGFFKTLKATYLREAQMALTKYHSDAIINSLDFDRHGEATGIEAFANGITIAGGKILADPLGLPLIPNWSRVISAIPDFFDTLLEAVEEDNKKTK
jgi:glucosyl-3-phosphoglycerate synthase